MSFIVEFFNCETVFDFDTKKQRLNEIERRMAEPGFWDNQERAQQVVGQLSSLRTIIKPLEDAVNSANDLSTMLELADEDPTYLPDVRSEIERLEHVFDDLELKS